MKTYLRSLAAAVVACTVTSCLQNETVITVKKDGSGTITEQTVFGAKAVGMMGQMSAAGGADVKDPIAGMFSKEKAEQRAVKLGEGVTVESVKILEQGGGKGALVTYKFADVNKLKVQPGGGMDDMAPNPGGEAQPEKKKGEPVTFNYAAGKLTVKMPDPAANKEEKKAAKEQAKEQMDNPQMQAMMKEMFKDMKMSVKLVAEPGIASSTATHVSGNTVILMEADFNELMTDDAAFKKLIESQPETTEEMEAALKGVKGMKAETKREIVVELK